MKSALKKLQSPGESLFTSIFQFLLFLVSPPGWKFIRRKLSRASSEHEIPYHQWAAKRALLPSSHNQHSIGISIIVTDLTSTTSLDNLLYSIQSQSFKSLKVLLPNGTQIPSFFNTRQVHQVPMANDVSRREYLACMVAAATTQYVLLVNSGQLLAMDCVAGFIEALQTNSDAGIIYSDHDYFNGTHFHTPYFKPDWSPDAVLAHNYIGDCYLISADLLKAVVGQLSSTETDYSYEILLRASEQGARVAHMPVVLIHNTAEANQPQKNTIEQALMRRVRKAEVVQVAGGYHIMPTQNVSGMVSLIIPTKDNATMLQTTMHSIVEKTKDVNYEIIVLNNNSTSPEFFKLVQHWQDKLGNRFKCIEAAFPFNFSKLINVGAQHAKGEFLLLLNNDVEVLQSDWLKNMADYAALSHIGAVGVKLLFPDRTIQHAGIVLGVTEASAHVLINKPADTLAHFCAAQLTQNYSAVTAACLMVRKFVFEKVHGMDEQLPVEFNDVDFCLKLTQAGFYNVYLPFVELIHYESATRGHPFRNRKSWKQHERDLKYFLNKWAPVVDNDPYYNPNLTRTGTDFDQARRIKL